jgi:hypothetical protein
MSILYIWIESIQTEHPQPNTESNPKFVTPIYNINSGYGEKDNGSGFNPPALSVHLVTKEQLLPGSLQKFHSSIGNSEEASSINKHILLFFPF